MNTDNMTISGETIDYGPCAFMDIFHPMRVFSSIDHHGRYAYARQPDVAMWNLTQLASSLMPLIDDVEAAQASIDRFPGLFQAAWLEVFRAKLGLKTEEEGDGDLVQALLSLMAKGSDFTNTFRALGTENLGDEVTDREALQTWESDWRARLARENSTPEDRAEAMQAVNPALIPRTHRIEEAIQAAVAGDRAPFDRLHAALATPFDEPGDFADLARPPAEDEIVPQTFCGT